MVEADLERYYGRDLATEIDVAGCRKLWVWIKGLPPEAAVWRDDGFSRTEEMLALLLERIDGWGRANWEIAARPQLKSPPSKFGLEPPLGEVAISRPGEQVEAEPASRGTDSVITDPREIVAFFGGMG